MRSVTIRGAGVVKGEGEDERELHGQYLRLLRDLETPAAHYWPRRLLWSLPWHHRTAPAAELA